MDYHGDEIIEERLGMRNGFIFDPNTQRFRPIWFQQWTLLASMRPHLSLVGVSMVISILSGAEIIGSVISLNHGLI
jgi:hypothetical protein